MRFYRFVGLLLVAILVVAPLSVFAQEGGEPELDTYTSEDELLTLSYPVDWVVGPSSFLYGAAFANSQKLMDSMQSEEGPEALPAGSITGDISVVTVDTFNSFGMPVEAGMAPEEILPIFLNFVAGGPPEGEGGAEAEGETESEGEGDAGSDMQMEPPVIGEVQTLEFADGRQAAWARVQYPGFSDDIWAIFELGEGIYGVLNFFTPPGELSEELIQTGLQMAESAQFTGTADDLAMPGPQVEQSDVDPATLDGDALVNERCTVCHTRERIDAAEKDLEGWTATVDRMISHGAQLNSAERLAVIHYLAGVPLEDEAGTGDTSSEPAQQEGDFTDYVSEDKLLSVRRPADWIETELPGFPFPGIAFLNTEEASGRVAREEDFAPGDKGFFAAILPLDVFAQFGAAPPENATITELGDFVAGIFGSPAEDATEEEIAAAKVGQAEEVELSEGVTAAQVEVSSLYEDDVYFIRDLGNGLVGLVVTAAATGEMDDAQVEVGRQAAASLSYEGTAEDIMAAMMAPPEVEQSDVDPATLDGNALVDERCTVCHTRERIDSQDKDEAGWTATVDRMIGFGADLDSAERQAVIDYLVATH